MKKNTKKNKSSALHQTIIRKNENVLARDSGDGTVTLLNLDEDNCFFTLDSIAAKFWLLLDGKRSLAEIEKELISKYKLEKNYLQENLSKLLNDLKRERLITLFRDS